MRCPNFELEMVGAGDEISHGPMEGYGFAQCGCDEL